MADDYIHERGGCPNAFRKFADSQQTKGYTKITFFGGSITEGAGASKPEHCYRALPMRHPAGLSRRDTQREQLGHRRHRIVAGRVSHHGDALYGGTALVFVEFAVNDGDAPEPQVYASMEGIVRQIFARDSSTDVVFLYTLVKDHMDAYKQGKLPDRVAWHEKIAAHYGIPSVNLGQYAAGKDPQGRTDLRRVRQGRRASDRPRLCIIHGGPAAVPRPLQGGGKPGRPARHAMPKPFSPAPMEHAQCVPYQLAKLDAGWKIGQPSPVDRFMHVLQSDRPGATLTLRFQGSQVGYFDAIGPDSCDFEVSLDGGPWKPQADFDSFCLKYTRPHDRAIATGLDPQKWHELRLRIAEKQPAAEQGPRGRIGWLLVDGRVEDPLDGLAPLARIDAIYAAHGPVGLHAAGRPLAEPRPHHAAAPRGRRAADRHARRQHHRRHLVVAIRSVAGPHVSEVHRSKR